MTGPHPPSTPDRPDEGLAIMFVLLSVLISMGLAIGLMGVLLSELTPTVYQRKSARTIAASQAGLQAALGAIRAATTTTAGVGTVGDRTKLPCLDATPLSGTLAGTSGSLGYSVRVRYYTVDPTDQPASWRNTAANQVPCVVGSGTASTPLYALVQSRATGDSAGAMLGATWGDRSSELVYALNRTDQAFIGGLIRTGLASTSADLCWQSTTSPPTAGDSLELAPCVPGKDAQTFSYRTDYSIVLSSTQAPTSPPTGGICVDGDRATSNKKKRRTTTTWVLTFQPCDGSWQQKWSYNDSGQLESVRSDLTSLSGLCVGSGGVYTAGTDLYVETCSTEWAPERTLGAGAAGATTSQLINYAEYGRCLDVTNQSVSHPWLIAYPCKQDPTRAVTWNQRFVWDSAASRQIQTNPGSPYCLTSPAAGSDRVLTTACVAGRSDQQWTMLGATGNRTTAYTVVDAVGRCLSLGPSPQVGGTLSQWSMITVETCDGSFKQKWNAPPLPTGGSLSGERETTRD